MTDPLNAILSNSDLGLLGNISYTPEFLLRGHLDENKYHIEMHNISGCGNWVRPIYTAVHSNTGYMHKDKKFTLGFNQLSIINKISIDAIIQNTTLSTRTFLLCYENDIVSKREACIPEKKKDGQKPIIIYEEFFDSDFKGNGTILQFASSNKALKDYYMIIRR